MRVWWDRRLKVMRVSTVAIVSTLIILLFFAGFTIYGNKVGNFVINVGSSSDVNLALSAHEDLSGQTNRLAYSALMALSDTTYQDLPEDISGKGLGNISDTANGEYMAYSFYLINNSDRSVDCDFSMELLDTVGDPLGLMRVMLIEEDNGTFFDGNRIYALAEQDTEALQREFEKYNCKMYSTEDFLMDESKIFSIILRDFEAGAARRFTILIWLEGCDPDCDNAHLGSRAKLQVDITGY